MVVALLTAEFFYWLNLCIYLQIMDLTLIYLHISLLITKCTCSEGLFLRSEQNKTISYLLTDSSSMSAKVLIFIFEAVFRNKFSFLLASLFSHKAVSLVFAGTSCCWGIKSLQLLETKAVSFLPSWVTDFGRTYFPKVVGR